MPANSWTDNDSYNELDPLNSLLTELSATAEEVETVSQYGGRVPRLEGTGVLPDGTLRDREASLSSLTTDGKGRRRKAAVVLTVVWSGTVALHLVSWGTWFVLGLTTVLGIHALRLVFTRPRRYTDAATADLPSVSILVAAKNEEAVIGDLVKQLCSLEYPDSQYDVWVIDDNSTDKTPLLLAELQSEYENLKVLHRSADAGGGKSGALNQVLPLTQGEILAVFDADAQVSPDLLVQVAPLFQQPKVGAVQVRKAITNAVENFWTKGQAAEMALDTYFQQQRIAISGIGELRGNGQFVRRAALESCGGWNEQTITDDLDLTFRLHLDDWDIDCLCHPAVQEEGVTTALALWHQRNRWAEGGYQRYLDYWQLIVRNRMGSAKTWDLLLFMLIMYLLPTAAIPDLLMAAIRHRPPLLTPVTGLSVTLSMAGMFTGLKRVRKKQQLDVATFFIILLQTFRGTFYMLHWFVVMSSTTARMSVRPKRLKWVKTVHQGKQ